MPSPTPPLTGWRRGALPLLLTLLWAPLGSAQMRVHVFDVGQAESILLEFSDAAVLIDAGGEDTGDSTDRDHLLGALDAFFEGRPDLGRTLYSVIVSHPHVDHTRHLMDVLRRYRVRNLVDGGGSRGSGIAPVLAARRFAGQRGIVYNRVTEARIGRGGYRPRMLQSLRGSASDVDIRFLGGGGAGCRDENNHSVVTLVTYREATFLFAGDAEMEDGGCTPEIQRILRKFPNTVLDVDVYKVGHHGSRNGTTGDLLIALTPAISVISAGHHSRRSPGSYHAWQFGHPREQIVARLEALTSGSRPPATVYTMDAVREVREGRPMSKAVYCTCWDGDVVISVDAAGRTFTVATSR